MLQNIIKIPHEDEPSDYIVRQSRYILYMIIALAIGALLLLLLLVYRASGVFVDWSETSMLGSFFGGVVGIGLLIAQLCIWGFVISKLVAYFYTMCVIESSKIIVLNYSLFFEDDVQIAELYRVLTIQATKSGIFESLCDFGDIELQMQNDTCLRIENIPKPKLFIERLEILKEYTIEQRLSSPAADIEEPAVSPDIASVPLSPDTPHDTKHLQSDTSSDVLSSDEKKATAASSLDGRDISASELSLSSSSKKILKKKLKKELKADLKQELKAELKEEIQHDYSLDEKKDTFAPFTTQSARAEKTIGTGIA